MKKLILLFTATVLLFSCTVDSDQSTQNSENLTVELASLETNLGIYKGVFTTNNSDYRATVDIALPVGNNRSDVASYFPSAKITLHTGAIYTAYAKQRIEQGEEVVDLEFKSRDLSLIFSVSADGSNPSVSSVIFKNMESSIAIAKHTFRSPVTPMTGTFECTTCNDHPNLNTGTAQTFNLMFTTPEGNSTITTQSAIGTAVFNGIGLQDNCVASGSLTSCDLASGDGVTNVGFMAGGAPVTWTGKHSFNNEATGPQDCSGALGNWTWVTPSYGTITGTFISDVNCFTELYSEDFNTFDGSGFAPTPTAGQLDSDIIIATGFSDGSLAYGGTETAGDFARGTSAGGAITGGIYSFETSTGDFALGVQPGGDDFTPGTFEFRIVNTTGAGLSQIAFSADIFINNDNGRSNSLTLLYSTDGSTFIPYPGTSTINSATTGDSLGFQLALDVNGSFPVTVADGAFIYFQVIGDDVSGSGSRDEFAIDNILVEGY